MENDAKTRHCQHAVAHNFVLMVADFQNCWVSSKFVKEFSLKISTIPQKFHCSIYLVKYLTLF